VLFSSVEISAPPSKLSYDEYTGRTLLAGKMRWWGRGFSTCPHMPWLRNWNC